MTKMDFAKFYKFCPFCGEGLEKSSENLLVCTQSHRIYINPRPTNAVIFESDQGKILLVRRKYPPFKDMLDLPGGFVDLYEDVEESTRREIGEELGIELEEIEYIFSVFDEYEYQDVIYPTICMTYRAKMRSEESIKVTDDISGFEFFDKKTIPYEEIGFPNMRKAIAKYVAQ